MANFGLFEHQQILEKSCRICGERLKKAKDKYENSFLGANRTEIIFTAFGVKVRKDDLGMCPPKCCHKCCKEKSCRICGERLKKAKDKYENSFLGANWTEIIFTAFGVEVRKDDLGMCPPKCCHKCCKLA